MLFPSLSLTLFLLLFPSLPLWGWLTVLPLLQISFWLLENGFSVLIAACDTFRAGAVEQLRTHTRRLSALHPPEKHGGRTMVQLFEKGYGKDAAGIAMEAIAFGTVHSKCGACAGPFAPGVLLELAEDQGYPTTNFLLSSSSELVMCHAMLHFGVTCSCRQTSCIRFVTSIFGHLYPPARASRVWLSGKESACQCRRQNRYRFQPWVGKIPCRRKWNPLQYSCLGNSWTEEPGGLQSTELQRVRHTECTHTPTCSPFPKYAS